MQHFQNYIGELIVSVVALCLRYCELKSIKKKQRGHGTGDGLK